MTQRLDKISKQHNGISSKPKLEPRHKRAQGPTKIKEKQVASTKWGVYSMYIYTLSIKLHKMVYGVFLINRWFMISNCFTKCL